METSHSESSKVDKEPDLMAEHTSLSRLSEGIVKNVLKKRSVNFYAYAVIRHSFRRQVTKVYYFRQIDVKKKLKIISPSVVAHPALLPTNSSHGKVTSLRDLML